MPADSPTIPATRGGLRQPQRTGAESVLHAIELSGGQERIEPWARPGAD